MPTWLIAEPADLTRLVQIGVTPESLHLDFKSALERGKPDAQAELGRDISQFANNQGGCLLLGVGESKDPISHIKTASKFTGVKDPEKDCEDIEKWIRNVLVPADFSRTVAFIQTPQGVVVAVNVPASQRLIWVADPGQSNRLEVVRRTNYGKEYMRPGEIERHWSNTLRSAQIAFNDALKEARSMHPNTTAEIEIVGEILRVAGNFNRTVQHLSGRPTLKAHDPRGFEVNVPVGSASYTLRIPFELLSTAWINYDGSIHILCVAPIVFHDDKKVLRFDPFGFLQQPQK